MFNAEEEKILGGIRYGLRQILPEQIEAIHIKNILTAITLDQELQLHLFEKEEISCILSEVKNQYLQQHPEVEKSIKRYKK